MAGAEAGAVDTAGAVVVAAMWAAGAVADTPAASVVATQVVLQAGTRLVSVVIGAGTPVAASITPLASVIRRVAVALLRSTRMADQAS
jgi:hypothetical protein